MNHDSYKAWIDAMPIDDVRARIERLERKLADLRVLERLHAERNGNGNGSSEPTPQGEPQQEGEGEGEGEGEPQGEPESTPEGGGGWTHGEGSPEHG